MWRALTTGDDDALDELLLAEVDTNLFLLSLASRPITPGTWAGHFDDERMTAVIAQVDSLLVPFTIDPSLELPWDGEPPALLVGPRAASDRLLRALPSPARIFDQRCYVEQNIDGHLDPQVRRAVEGDLPAIRAGSIAMSLEDLGVDPRDRFGPERFERILRSRIAQGRSFVLHERGAVRAQLFVGSLSAWGCQLAGTWVPPSHRGRGMARRLVRSVADVLLADLPRVGLHVREDNVAAVRTYEGAGFRRGPPFRLARWDLPDSGRSTT